MVIKNLILVPRILYTAICTLIPLLILELYGLNMIAGTALFIFIFSFIWQYLVLYPALSFVPSGILRGCIVFVLNVLSVFGIFSGLDFLYDVDLNKILMYQLVGRMSLYLFSVSLMVGLSCTWRTLKLQQTL